jgi:hypothetical protein
MALAVTRDARMGVAEYRVRFEACPDPALWKLLDSEPVAMSPGSDRQNLIRFNLARSFADRNEVRIKHLRRETNPDRAPFGPGGSIDIREFDGRIVVAPFYLPCGIS